MLAALTLGVLLVGCGGKAAPGTLQGTVKIGPIFPVERPGSQPPVPPEVFKARKIQVYDTMRNNLIKEVEIEQIGQGQTGYYHTQLSPGSYIVDINHTGIDRSSEVPVTVEIKSGQWTELNIDIDTGIR